jgi:phosphocarrier protein
MSVMMLAASKGTELLIRAEGEDEAAAIDAITALIEDYFGEGE